MELTIETSEWCLWCCFGVSIVNFEQGLHHVLLVDFEQVNVNRDIQLRPFNFILITILPVYI